MLHIYLLPPIERLHLMRINSQLVLVSTSIISIERGDFGDRRLDDECQESHFDLQRFASHHSKQEMIQNTGNNKQPHYHLSPIALGDFFGCTYWPK